jgi:hypothetical protein
MAISPDQETGCRRRTAMCQRAILHRLVDSLPEEDLTTAGRLLVGLTMTADPVERALLLAPVDDEPDTDDDDGGLTEARRELARGEGISTEELQAGR